MACCGGGESLANLSPISPALEIYTLNFYFSTEVLHLSRNPDQCVLQVNGATLKQVEKFKYLGVAFTSDGRQDEELDTRIGKASAVMRALHYSVVMKRELSKKAKLSIFKAVFVPILT